MSEKERNDNLFSLHRIVAEPNVALGTVLKCDSIEVPYPVKSKLSWWDNTRMRLGEVAIGLMVIVGIYFCIKIL